MLELHPEHLPGSGFPGAVHLVMGWIRPVASLTACAAGQVRCTSQAVPGGRPSGLPQEHGAEDGEGKALDGSGSGDDNDCC